MTYLGSLVEGIGPDLKYALVAGAVTGGGLTVIANAPNPAGVGILQTAKAFESEGISPLGLFLGRALADARRDCLLLADINGAATTKSSQQMGAVVSGPGERVMERGRMKSVDIQLSGRRMRTIASV